MTRDYGLCMIAWGRDEVVRSRPVSADADAAHRWHRCPGASFAAPVALSRGHRRVLPLARCASKARPCRAPNRKRFPSTGLSFLRWRAQHLPPPDDEPEQHPSDIAARTPRTPRPSSPSTNAVSGSRDGARPNMFADLDEGLWGIVSQLPLKRLLIWAAFAWLVYLCRPFMGVLFGTFVVSYVGVSFCQWVGRRLVEYDIQLPRRAIVSIYYACIALFITTTSLVTIPRIVREGQYFVGIIRSSNPYVWIADTMRRALGDELSAKVEALVMSDRARAWSDAEAVSGALNNGDTAGSTAPTEDAAAADGGAKEHAQMPRPMEMPRSERQRERDGRREAPIPVHGRIPITGPAEEWTEERSRRLGLMLQKALSQYVNRFASIVSRILGDSTKIIVKVLLSLVFSFLIVWDLPSVARGVRSLRKSRLRAAYSELAPAVSEFFTLLGRSFEAQSMIALVNTTLTTIGMAVLGLPGIGFLSLLCLICSFIPLVGIMLSTLPMCIVALTEYGAMRAFLVVVMVALVHLVEAYFLNPRIYSAHLKLPPLVVLAVLYIGEHAAGVMGLVLAVPITVYALRWMYGEAGTESMNSATAWPEADASADSLSADPRL